MGLFDVDFYILNNTNLPVRLRQAVQIAWLNCLNAPVRYIYDRFKKNREANVYLLAHNSQVCYMEAALNDAFDPADRGIFISDPPYYDPVYTFLDAEDEPVYLDLDSEIGTAVIDDPDPVPLYLDSEVIYLAPMFIVNVPVAITFDMDRMKALIDLYRLPGRNVYSIVTF